MAGAAAPDTRAHPHIVMSKHSSTWETLALNLYFRRLRSLPRRSSCRSRSSDGDSSVPITIDRKAGTDAMEQIVAQGKDRFAEGF